MSKNFVFTSAGKNTDFDEIWIGTNMNYDLYVIYYADDDTIYDKYKSKVTFIEKRKGSKFQNFHYFYKKYPEIIEKYDRFLIIDDDIIMQVEDINRLFDISRKYELDICQPSLSLSSKFSHRITQHVDNCLLRYTNFVEVNTVTFSRSALDKLMEKYDPILIGYGVDFLYIWANGLEKENKYAIIDAIQIFNPLNFTKKISIRELFLIPNVHNRQNDWESYSKQIGCPTRYDIKMYSMIPLE